MSVKTQRANRTIRAKAMTVHEVRGAMIDKYGIALRRSYHIPANAPGDVL